MSGTLGGKLVDMFDPLWSPLQFWKYYSEFYDFNKLLFLSSTSRLPRARGALIDQVLNHNKLFTKQKKKQRKMNITHPVCSETALKLQRFIKKIN